MGMGLNESSTFQVTEGVDGTKNGDLTLGVSGLHSGDVYRCKIDDQVSITFL